MKYIKLFENFEKRLGSGKGALGSKGREELEKLENASNFSPWEVEYFTSYNDGRLEYDNKINIPRNLAISTLEELFKPFKHFDKFVICGNMRIAGQNITTLNVGYDYYLEYPPLEEDEEELYENPMLKIEMCDSLVNLDGMPKGVNYLAILNNYNKQSSSMLNLEGCINTVKNIDITGSGILSLKGCPAQLEDFYFNRSRLLSLKYLPILKNVEFLDRGTTAEYLLSTVNDYGYQVHEEKNLEYFYDKEIIKDGIDNIPKPMWFEALAFVGARAPEDYLRVCQDFPEETKFTDEQVEDYLNSPLIDRKSTEDDWKIAKDILDRMKKYDHSEYRDSKLDSEWKEIF